jgi:hypothetical protein
MISIKGRRGINDFLVGRNDEKIFNSSLHFLSDILTNVTKYQFIQEIKGTAVLLLVPNKNFNTSEIISIKGELDKKMKGIIDFEIKVEEKLILSSRGKYQMFISNILNN